MYNSSSAGLEVSFVRSLLKVAGRPTEVVIYLGVSEDPPSECDNP